MDPTPLRHPAPDEGDPETVVVLPQPSEKEVQAPSRWKRMWLRFRHYRASEPVPDNDPVTCALKRVRQVEAEEKPRPTDMPSHEPTNGEDLAILQATVTYAAFEAEYAPKVDKIIREVVRHATAEQVAAASIARLEEDMRAHEEMLGDADRLRAERHRNDPRVMRYLPPWQIAAIEALLVGVDASLLYLYFARDFDSTVSLFAAERIGAVVISLFPPLAGVILARFAGRALGCWHHATDEHRRRSTLPALVGVALTVMYVVAAWLLIDWRFSKAAVGASAHSILPGSILATIFVVAILALLAIHAFLESPSGYEDAQREKELATLRARLESAYSDYEQARARKEAALQDLAGIRVPILTYRDRLLGKVESVVSQGRALDPHSPRSTPWSPQTAAEGSWRLDLGAPALEGRLLKRIQEVLDRYGSDDLTFRERVQQLHERVQALLTRYPRSPRAASPHEEAHEGARVIPLRGDRDENEDEDEGGN